VPFSEIDTVFFGAGFEQTTIKPGTTCRRPTRLRQPVRATSTAIPLTLGWSRDNRDSALAPNSGRYQRLNLTGLRPAMRATCGATTSTSSTSR
jgi:outer membrane protein insertion porin family